MSSYYPVGPRNYDQNSAPPVVDSFNNGRLAAIPKIEKKMDSAATNQRLWIVLLLAVVVILVILLLYFYIRYTSLQNRILEEENEQANWIAPHIMLAENQKVNTGATGLSKT